MFPAINTSNWPHSLRTLLKNNMNIKTTILISAATFFVLNFILWAVGWLIWPIIWASSGIALLKLGDWLSVAQIQSPWWIKTLAALLGPIMILALVISSFSGEFFDFKKLGILNLPKVRNPFIWPEKEFDKQNNKD